MRGLADDIGTRLGELRRHARQHARTHTRNVRYGLIPSAERCRGSCYN